MYRTERDSLGAKKVPSKAYYGVFTQRAIENFPISGIPTHKELFYAIALEKIAAARAHAKLGLLDEKRAKAIEKAGTELLKGKFDSELVVDSFQAGAGTATHMNVNEVIANRAGEILHKRKGSYYVHSNNHVNMGQSTNNVYPTAMRIACLNLSKELEKEMSLLEESLEKKSIEFKNVLKVGRTHLQDAVPITLGQEFQAYKEYVSRNLKELRNAMNGLKELGVGGTAVGTGITTHPEFARSCVQEINKLSKEEFRPTKHPVYLTQSQDSFIELSNALKQYSLNMIKICNDLVLMSSGPRSGFSEILLPEVEPGSSIMPGKVNPSMVEAYKMVCLQCIGNSETIERSASEGQLELNTMTPVIAFALINSIKWLTSSTRAFREKCVKGIKAYKEHASKELEASLSTATALNPYLGYQNVAKLVKIAERKNLGLHDVILIMKLMERHDLEKVIDVKGLVHPRVTDLALIRKVQSGKAFKRLNSMK